MIIIASIASLAVIVAAYAKHKAKTWTPPDHTLAKRLVTAHSVRI